MVANLVNTLTPSATALYPVLIPERFLSCQPNSEDMQSEEGPGYAAGEGETWTKTRAGIRCENLFTFASSGM